MKTLFLTLKTFSITGGIEKVCKVAARAMYENSLTARGEFEMYSMYDPSKANTQPYIPSNIFEGFDGKKLKFLTKSFLSGIKSKLVVLSHINLLLAGYIVKLFSPKTKIVLMAHGKEVWSPLSSFKKRMLNKIDLIIPVSEFTKEKMKSLFGIPEAKFRAINNCLDPFLPPPTTRSRRNESRSIYGIAETDIVLMTFNQAFFKEVNKGYDKVLIAVKKLHVLFPQLKYLLVGKYEEEEKTRLDSIIHDLGIEYDTIFTGFVPDSVLADYYNMADVCVIPESQESFGFSFIEALYYDKPVIAGNYYGPAESPVAARLATIINTLSQEEVIAAIQKIIENVNAHNPNRELLLEKFSFSVYKDNFRNVMDHLFPVDPSTQLQTKIANS